MTLLSTPLLLLVPAIAPGSDGILIAEGDVLPGGDVVRDVIEIAVNDAGQWGAVVELDRPELAQAVVLDGQVLYRTGDPLPGKASGTFFDRAFGLELSATGVLTWIETTDGFGFEGRAVFANDTALLAAGQPPIGPDLALASSIERIQVARDDGVGGLFVGCRLVPGPNPTLDGWVLLHLPSPTPDVPVELVAASGDPLSDGGPTITTVAAGRELLDGAGGRSLYHVRTGIVDEAIVLDGEPVVRTGDSSPLFGFPWLAFRETLAVNSAGSVAFTGLIEGPIVARSVLAVDGALVAVTGGPAPVDPSFEIESLGQVQFFGAPIELDEAGRIHWYADWDDPDTERDEALHRDLDVVVQEGVSRVDGVLVTDLTPPGIDNISAEFAVSPDGSLVAVRVALEDGRVVAALVRPDAASTPLDGCGGNLASLTTTTPTPGAPLLAELANAQASGALGLVALSIAPALPGSECGIDAGGAGELLVDATPGALLALEQGPLLPAASSTSVSFGLIPDDVALLGLELFTQGAFVAPADAQPVRLSNAIGLRVGL